MKITMGLADNTLRGKRQYPSYDEGTEGEAPQGKGGVMRKTIIGALLMLFLYGVCFAAPGQGGPRAQEFMPGIWLSVLAKHYEKQPVSEKVTPKQMKVDRDLFI